MYITNKAAKIARNAKLLARVKFFSILLQIKEWRFDIHDYTTSPSKTAVRLGSRHFV